MTRLPIRVRLTLAFTAAMAIVLVALGAFVYLRVASSVREQLDDSLELRAQSLAPVLRERSGRITARQADDEDAEAFSQLIDPAATVPETLLSVAEVERARRDGFFLTRESLPALDGESGRLFVSPVRTAAGERILVVAASLEDQEETIDELLAQLLIGGPLALALAAAVGYAVAGAALRPVDAMRLRAEQVSTERTGQRLPLPAAHDEIRRLGETLNAMLGRLEAGLERERRFVADASHELRTPLALLRTELELSQRRPRSPHELETALASAAEEVDRLARLAEDLLVLARVDEGRLPLRCEQLSARDVLETVAQRFAHRAEQAGRRLELADPADVTLMGDRLRLEQALGNLVDNALRHGSGRISLAATSSDGAVELRVSDEGAGFPADVLPRVFDRFATGDAARSGGSTGLGLSIVDAIARAHGGSARAFNVGGHGAAVSLRLPRAVDDVRGASLRA